MIYDGTEKSAAEVAKVLEPHGYSVVRQPNTTLTIRHVTRRFEVLKYADEGDELELQVVIRKP